MKPWLTLLLAWFIVGPLQAAQPTARLITTFTGDLHLPSAVALDGEGNPWVLNGLPRQLVLFNHQGQPIKRLPLPAPKGRPTLPATDLAADHQHLYVADPGYGRLLILNHQGQLIRIITPRPNGQAAEPVSVLAAGSWLWWSDRRHHRLCRTSLKAPSKTHCVGQRGSDDTAFHYPYSLAQDDQGYLLVVDVLNGRIQVRSMRGDAHGTFGQFGNRPGELYRPNGIALFDQVVAVSDAYLGTLTLFRQRLPLGQLQTPQGKPWRFNMPVGLAAQGQRLYVVEMGAHRVQLLELTTLPSQPMAAPPPRPSRRDCVICHFSWTQGNNSDEASPGLPVASPRMCLSCHHGAVVESRHRLGKGHQHPPLTLDWMLKKASPADGTHRPSKDQIPSTYPLLPDQRLYCGSCHTPHNRSKGGQARHPGHQNSWLRKANNNSALCTDCHASKARHQPGKSANHPVGIRLRPPPKLGASGYAQHKTLQQGLPDTLAALGARLGDEDQLICQSCHLVHGANGQSLLVTRQGASKLCIACHREQHAQDLEHARQKGLHPSNGKLEKKVKLAGRVTRQLDCLACHSVHNAEPGTALLPRGFQANTLCRVCHQRQWADSRKQAQSKHVHPVNLSLDPPVELGGKKINKVECLSCHSVHHGVNNSPALMAQHRDGTLCKACHLSHLSVEKTDHDLRHQPAEQRNGLQQTYAEAGLCGACHSMHQANRQVPFLFSGPTLPEEASLLPRDRLCLACHQPHNRLKAHAVEKWTHPWKDLILRSNPKVMPLLDDQGNIAQFGRIGCITCHEPHHWHPKTPPSASSSPPKHNQEGTVLSSFLRRKGVTGTFCVDCHGPQAHLKYKFFHDPQGRNKNIDYLR